MGQISRIYFCLRLNVVCSQHKADRLDFRSGVRGSLDRAVNSCKYLIFNNKCDGAAYYFFFFFLRGSCLLFMYTGVELTASWLMELAQH